MIKVLSYLLKNTALVVGIVEALAKLVAGVVSLTPTKADDKLIPKVNDVASKAKKVLYGLSEKS